MGRPLRPVPRRARARAECPATSAARYSRGSVICGVVALYAAFLRAFKQEASTGSMSWVTNQYYCQQARQKLYNMSPVSVFMATSALVSYLRPAGICTRQCKLLVRVLV